MIRFVAFFCLLWAAGTAAEVPVQDLGEGLAYIRVKAATDVLPAAPTGPLIVDLRGFQGSTEPLRAVLAGPAIRIVLVNQDTDTDALADLGQRSPGTLVVAPAGVPKVDFPVGVSAEDDRKGYAALDNGADLSQLAHPPLAKARRDEASILRERQRRSGGQGPDRSAAGNEAATAPASDPVLQRAVQLHRGLRALNRL